MREPPQAVKPIRCRPRFGSGGGGGHVAVTPRQFGTLDARLAGNRDVGKEVVLQRRKDYWGERPHIETVVLKVVNDHGTAFNALKSGACSYSERCCAS